MKNESLYRLFLKDRVDAESVADFLTRYYKPDRYTGRGADYAACLLASKEEEVTTKGFALISHHDSITGNPVSYYPHDRCATWPLPEGCMCVYNPGGTIRLDAYYTVRDGDNIYSATDAINVYALMVRNNLPVGLQDAQGNWINHFKI